MSESPGAGPAGGSTFGGSTLDGSTLDGNVLAGALGEIFAADITSALGQCASCLRTGPLAETRVYSGAVARCPACAAVVLRIVRAPDRAWLYLRGLRCIQFAIPADQ
jgi:hypothetical protein